MEATTTATRVTRATRRRATLGEQTLRAARRVLALGLPLTSRAIAEDLGVSRKAVNHRVQTLKEAGRWPYTIVQPAPRPPEPPKTPKARAIDARDLAFLAAGASVADPRDRVNFDELARAFGRGKPEAQSRITSLRKRGLWPYSARPDHEIEGADPAVIAGILAESRKLMGDARHEIDDPLEHGVCAAPRSGKVHKLAELTPARACRLLLREWRVVTGRAKPEPKPRHRPDYPSDGGRVTRVYRLRAGGGRSASDENGRGSW